MKKRAVQKTGLKKKASTKQGTRKAVSAPKASRKKPLRANGAAARPVSRPPTTKGVSDAAANLRRLDSQAGVSGNSTSRLAGQSSTGRDAIRIEKAKRAAEPSKANSSPSATSQDPIQFEEEKPRKLKTYLSASELQEFKRLLLQKRAELTRDVERLTSEALNRKGSDYSEHSSMPIHMADLGSDTWEQDFTLGLIANEQALLREIDDALARIQDKTYGMCVATQNRISRERLRAKPWAKYCIEYARLREEGRAP